MFVLCSGLGKTSRELKESIQNDYKKTVKKRVVNKEPRAVGPSRRSGRATKEPVQYTDEDLDRVLPRLSSPKKSGGGRRGSVFVAFTEEQRAALKNAKEDWVDDFHDFLLHTPHGRQGKCVSVDNARSVIRQTELLAAGTGITYRHWDQGVYFAKVQSIDSTVYS
jgi:hypothetical protein